VAQPMSDVPATTFWLIAVALAWLSTGATGAMAAGIATGFAVLIRPNLAPLAVVVAFACAMALPRGADLRRRGVAYLCGMTPGVVVLALLNRHLYGSPLASGYGSFASLFALGNVAPNSRAYAGWLAESETPLLALSVLAPVFVGTWRGERANPKP